MIPTPDRDLLSALTPAPAYAELHCLSNFSFQRGAAHADELVARARELGYTALAITDECSLAGIVRAHDAAKALDPPLHLIVGAEFRLQDGPRFVLLAPDRAAYAQLSRLITRGRQHSPKGEYALLRRQCDELRGCLAIWLPEVAAGDESQLEAGRWLASCVAQCWIGVVQHRVHDDAGRMAQARRLAAVLGLECIAAGEVRFDTPSRKPLHDVLTAVRLGRPVAECGRELLPNAEAHLRSREELASLYPPAMLAQTAVVAARCGFVMTDVKYEYPSELVPRGETPASHLRQLTAAGVRRRWPEGAPPRVLAQIEKELALIGELKYEAFFLTVFDIVEFANRRGILCQGRGSAANSAVCYALGVTAVKPENENLLFERFISKERNEPPDIDVDFEHERREEVIQYVFEKYGRDRCAIAATVIRYRARSALRDVGAALGMEPEDVDTLTKTLAWWDRPEELDQRLGDLGFDPAAPRMRQWIVLTRALIGFPRHLSQHVGGFLISGRPLDELVPIENASMPDRQVIQWDKDDLESLGLLKVDVLALGMLSALRDCFDLMRSVDAADAHTLQSLPRDDEPTFEMIRRAETIGVFQIESRAQQSMLPRLQPADFYDLVVQIAIVRPGPITGGMVHPYLQRREQRRAGLTDFGIPKELEPVLGRTLGVPIFQEQVMRVAMIAASFTPGEADEMRRSMAAWKQKGGLEHFHDRLVGRMVVNGYEPEFAEQIYQRILGFGSYGFPESHSASFAQLAWASAWLKCHRPAAFMAALVNSQPMGFYPVSMLIGEARRVGVEVRAVDVCHSVWACTLERRDDGDGADQPAIRLGLRLVGGFNTEAAAAIVATRRQSPLRDVDDLARRARLDSRELGLLAGAGALAGLAGHRHAARWEVAAQFRDTALSLPRAPEGEADLRAPSAGEDVLGDYRSLGLSLRDHPLALVRERLARRKVTPCAAAKELVDRSRVRVAGMVMFRQRPPTAKGVMFMTIEDESGSINLILRARYIENHREVVLGARIVVVTGQVQNVAGVVNVMVEKLDDISGWFAELPATSRDFR